MKLKGLSYKDGEWISGRRMTDGYAGSVSIGSAKNLSVGKLNRLGLALRHSTKTVNSTLSVGARQAGVVL
jgi:hypothetical protein